MTVKTSGTIFIIATPIGNMGDLSSRAKQTLDHVAAVCAEDTRHTGGLLRDCGINKPLIALHEHNEQQIIERLLSMLSQGADLALVSDAGTPLISDPGFRIVRAARQAGIRVSPIPGPCAAIAALSVAGIASDRFCFEGFLPAKAAARKQRIADLADEQRTLIFYESSHRIVECLNDLASGFGAERPAVMARELTKLFETVAGETLGELCAFVKHDMNQRKGEFVLIVQGAQEALDRQLLLGQQLFTKLRVHMSPSQAAKIAAEISGASRKVLYAEGSVSG